MSDTKQFNEQAAPSRPLSEVIISLIENMPEGGYLATDVLPIFEAIGVPVNASFAARADGLVQPSEIISMLSNKAYTDGLVVDSDQQTLSVAAVQSAQQILYMTSIHDPQGDYILGLASLLQHSEKNPDLCYSIGAEKSCVSAESPEKLDL